MTVFYSIITVASDTPKELKYTGRSLAVQNEAPPFEWLIAGSEAPNAQEDEIAFPPALTVATINEALARASGEYVWFLPAGECLSDAFVLRDVKREMISHTLPDFYYAAWREGGVLTSPKNFSSLAGSLPAPLAAMIFRRRMIGEVRFDASYTYAADYDFVLRVADRTAKIAPSTKIVVDLLNRPQSMIIQRQTRTERFVIREKLLLQNKAKNTLIDWGHGVVDVVKMRFPKIYRAGRNMVFPAPIRRKESPVKGNRRGIFFKRR